MDKGVWYVLQAHFTVARVGGEGLGQGDHDLREGGSRQDEVGGLNNRGNRSHGAKVWKGIAFFD